ncbi:HAD family hydrolase [Nocardia sp. IFM 10818]
MTVRGILFDVDDTLFDYSASARVGVIEHLRAEGLLEKFESEEAAARLWRGIEDEEYARFRTGEITFTGQRIARTERFLASIGVTVDDPDAWFSAYLVQRDLVMAAFPDALPTLRSLHGRVGLGVVSNSVRAMQEHKLRSTGLLPYLGEAILCCVEFGVAKPDPSIFLAGCDMIGLPPEQVAYVGNDYEIDAVAARDAGLQSFWLDRRGGAAVDDGITVIHSLTELTNSYFRPVNSSME